MRRVIFRTVGLLAAVLFLMQGPSLSFANESLCDILARDGKLKLIVKFKDFVADRIAVKMASGELVADNEINEYILRKIDKKYNLKKLKRLFKDKALAQTTDDFAAEFGDYFVIEIDRDERYAQWIARSLQRFYEIDMAEVDIEVKVETTPLPDVAYIPNDYYITSDNATWRSGAWGQSYPDMWGLQKIQALEAWGLFADAKNGPGRDIVVAVIDTGVDFSHPDLNANMWVNPNEIAANGIDDDGNGYIDDVNGWDFVNNDNDPRDGHGHGTHVSGTIAAVADNALGVAGIAPNAKIMAVKGLSDGGYGDISWLANCIIYAANNGADILNNSWGAYGSSYTLANAVNYAYSKGCVIIAAAGNDNTDAGGHIPSSYPRVIGVAATDQNDVKSWFSNYGAGVDISAPGSYILSTLPASYASWSGTSMASPQVSGAAALILSLEPALTNAEVRQRLMETSDDIYGKNSGYQGLLGAGRLNAYKAILAGAGVNHPPVLDAVGNKAVNENGTLSFKISAVDPDGDALIYSVFDELPGSLAKSGNAGFFVQSETVYSGTRSLQSGAVASGGYSAVSKNIDLPLDGTVTFCWKVSSHPGSGKFSFYIDGVKDAELSGELDWREESFDMAKGAHSLKWVYRKSTSATSGSDAGWIDDITISYGGTTAYDFEDGQVPADFRTGGDGSFYVQDTTARTGSYALMADPSIANNEWEYIETTIDAAEATELSFYWKVSCEYYYDFLEFYIDGILKNKISGEVSWSKKAYTLNAGTHTLKWRYAKDYSVTRGEDTGWIDDITIDATGREVIDFEPRQGEPNALPEGASFDAATQTFSWKPTYRQAGIYPSIRFTATEDTEDALSDYEDITITVNDVNGPPLLEPIGAKTVNEMDLLQFTISASDPEGDELAYSASNLPTGATFDSATRTFSWTPTYQQSGRYHNIHFEVSDGSPGGSTGVDQNTKLLIHGNEDGGLIDSSDTGYTVTTHGGAGVDISVKKFGNGSIKLNGYSDYLTVPDSGDWNMKTNFTVDFWVKHNEYRSNQYYINQTDSNANRWFLYNDAKWGLLFRIISNGSTVVYALGRGITDTEWHHIAIVKDRSDYGVYLDGAQISYSRYSGSINDFAADLCIGQRGTGAYYLNGNMDEIRITHSNPFGASPNSGLTDTITVPGGEYSAESGGTSSGGNKDSEDITVTVLDVNYGPVLNEIGNKIVDEGGLLEFTISATDINGDTLTYLASNLPAGAEFDSAAQTFKWQPGYDQAGTYPGIHFEVTDTKAGDAADIVITVNNVNMPPVLSSIGNKVVGENELLEFTVTATDYDSDTLTYSVTNGPSGASFNTSSRIFSWTPDYTDAGTYADVVFTVTDGIATDQEAITITVSDVNRKPVIEGLVITPGSLVVKEGESLTIAVNASDPDGDPLSYSVSNNPEGSGFVNNDFYWVPGYEQEGVYSGIRFTVYDGSLFSDPSDPVTITVTNAKDAPVFITEPALIGSYTIDGEAEDVVIKGGYAYVAYGPGGLKVLDISRLNNIYEIDAIDAYDALNRIVISGDYAYLIDAGRQVDILDITTPSMPVVKGAIPETGALDLAVYNDIAYLACTEGIALYDILDKDLPKNISGYDMGKAERIAIVDNYAYTTGADEDIKTIDLDTAEVLASDIVESAASFPSFDITASGNDAYIAKGSYGIAAFNVMDLTAPSQAGEFNLSNIEIKELRAPIGDRIYAIGYDSASDTYRLIYIHSADTAAMNELWSYSFAAGLAVNNFYADGNRLFVAGQNGLDIITSPLEDTYTVEAGRTLKITVYAGDPDGDDVTYTMNNRPAFDEAIFSDNGDGTAVFMWTPAEAQIGTYEGISFSAKDPYQQTDSKDITISVIKKKVNAAAATKLLIHGNDDITDNSEEGHSITEYGDVHTDSDTKKWGSGSLKFNGYSDYLSVPDSDDWNMDENFTIELWVKHTDYCWNQYYINQTENNINRWFLYKDATWGLLFRVMSGGSTKVYLLGNKIEDTEWHHIAVVKVGNKYAMYLDGEETAYDEYDGQINNFAGDLCIGQRSSDNYYFYGNMDELRISRGNPFGASPNPGLTDTITVPSTEHN